MEAHATDVATPENEVRLRGGPSTVERLLAAGIGIAILLLAQAELVIIAVALKTIGACLFCYAAFAMDEFWNISRNGVRIGKARPFGRLQSTVIRPCDIVELRMRSDRGLPERFAVFLRLVSGDQLTSPSIAEITRVDEASRRIAELLGTPQSTPPANPLDASNAEIRIGKPVRRSVRTEARILVLVIAGFCTIIYAHRFWYGLSLSIPEMVCLPIGIVVAFLVFRYAHTFSGTSWIVRHGELRVEKLSRDGKPSVDAIRSLDIETISIEQPGEGWHAITVELCNGKKIRSPEIGTEAETRAVLTEIALRLRIAPERVRR